MANVSLPVLDTYPTHEWKSHSAGYPFQVNQAGRMVYYGRAMAGIGSWEGQGGEAGYITLDGTPQELTWLVQFQHRPVRIELFHEDSGNVPSSTNFNIDYEFRERAMTGGNNSRWVSLYSGVGDEPTVNVTLGESYEVRDVEYRLTLNGHTGDEIRVSPYNQYLQPYQFGGRRQRTR